MTAVPESPEEVPKFSRDAVGSFCQSSNFTIAVTEMLLVSVAFHLHISFTIQPV